MGGIQWAHERIGRLALGLLSSTLAGAALWYVLRTSDWTAFATEIRLLDWRWIAAAVVFDVLGFVLQGFRWRSLLRPVANVSLGETSRAIYAGLFVNEVVPMRPGEFLRGLIISRDVKARDGACTIARLLPSMVVERLMDGAVLVVAAVVVGMWTPAPAFVTNFVRIGAGVAMVLVLFVILCGRRVPETWRTPLRNPSAIIASAAMFLVQGFGLWGVLKGCHLDLSFFAGLAIWLVIRVGTVVPLAPANLGTHQLSTVLGLSLFGVSGSQAASVAFIVFAVLTIPLLVLGAVAAASSGIPLRAALRSSSVFDTGMASHVPTVCEADTVH